jgi:hypothetical protein
VLEIPITRFDGLPVAEIGRQLQRIEIVVIERDIRVEDDILVGLALPEPRLLLRLHGE